MKRIKITENQYELIRLLKENIDFVENTKEKMKDLKKTANKLYNVLTFSTIAEIIDGDTDLGVIELKVEKLWNDLSVIDTNISNYFNRYDEETYYAKKLDDVHSDLENRSNTIWKKQFVLADIIKQLKPFTRVGDDKKLDADKAFSDIKPTEI